MMKIKQLNQIKRLKKVRRDQAESDLLAAVAFEREFDTVIDDLRKQHRVAKARQENHVATSLAESQSCIKSIARSFLACVRQEKVLALQLSKAVEGYEKAVHDRQEASHKYSLVSQKYEQTKKYQQSAQTTELSERDDLEEEEIIDTLVGQLCHE